MEEKNVNMSTSGGTPASSRWNPTKEQISMLEGLYSQGIRTPTAEQIQQITSRLKAFGHIEGKNVFYWFQNHKARQRQKQKQENMVYINRFLHNSAPVFAPPPPTPMGSNVICSPFYLQRGSIGCYPPHPKIILSGSVRRRARTDKLERIKASVDDGAGSEPARHKYEIMYTGDVNEENMNIINHNNPIAHETLPLFPLHPTGILEGRASRPFSATAAECSYPSSPSETSEVTEGSSDQPFFDFFAGNRS